MSAPRPTLHLRYAGAGPRDVARVILTFACLIATVWILGAMLFYARYGLDLTDEGYYLNWISTPDAYSASTTQFGYVYHPLYVAVGGDLVWLRRANLLILFGLGSVAAWLALTRVLRQPSRGFTTLIAATSAACTTMLAFHVNLVTPSYNSLTVSGALIVVIGLLLDPEFGPRETTRRTLAAPWALVGIGGTLVFLAKPTAGAALGALVLAYLIVAGTWRSWRLPWAGGTAAAGLLAFILVVDRSVLAFVERLSVGAERLAELGAGHETSGVLRWDDLDFDEPFRDALILALVVVALAGLAFGCRSRIGAGVCGALAIGSAWYWLRFTESEPDVVSARELIPKALIFVVPMAAVVLVAVLARRPDLREVGRTRWALAALLLALPHATALGSNLHYWQQAGIAAIGWMLAAIVLLAPFDGRPWVAAAVLPMALMAQAITYSIVFATLEWPYRQAQPVFEFTEQVEVGPAGTTVFVTDAAAPFLRETRAVFAEHGLADGHPVIDLTGQSPGVVWAGGATAIDHPWVIGGYPGSDDHQRAALAVLDCAVAVEAWVLVEDDGPRSLDPEVLSAFGASEADYAEAARWDAPQIGRRPWDVDRGSLVLWEPQRTATEAVAACEAEREEASGELE